MLSEFITISIVIVVRYIDIQNSYCCCFPSAWPTALISANSGRDSYIFLKFVNI